MPSLTVEVPAAHRADLRRQLLTLYGVLAEATHFATEEYLGAEGQIEALLASRARLAAVDALLDQVGWREEPRRSVEITGESAVVVDSIDRLFTAALEPVMDLVGTSGDTAARIAAAGPVLDRATTAHRLLADTYERSKRACS
jgi:hypothetical protein